MNLSQGRNGRGTLTSFTSPAEKSSRKKRAETVVLSRDVESKVGYATCPKCGHLVALKRAAFSDRLATPPIKQRVTPLFSAHSPEGYRSRTARNRCWGTDTVPTGPVFENLEN